MSKKGVTAPSIASTSASAPAHHQPQPAVGLQKTRPRLLLWASSSNRLRLAVAADGALVIANGRKVWAMNVHVQARMHAAKVLLRGSVLDQGLQQRGRRRRDGCHRAGGAAAARVLEIYICREGFRCSGEASAIVITETRKLGIAVLQRGQLVQFCPSLTMLTRAL